MQLNKKFNFLESARCCIDLCAAPGGWLQVASKQMAPGSLIVGVDLVPIKPIPRCITFAEDINSYKCRDQLRAEMKDWKADVVLHDGAPNVGTAWVQDAYAQSELVLQSLKLAVEFLAPGGVFVTKVFRSKDYNNLLWVFNQLFRKVEATKPPSSRNVSAEIFVVCQEFKAPKRIDPKFLDPRHVFKDLDPTAATSSIGNDSATGNAQAIKLASNAVANVFEPEKKRRKREGYADGETVLFKAIGARDFIEGADAVGLLGTFNEIQFKREEDKKFLDSVHTDANITACCEDLKVLGKKDFRTLLKWRKDWREDLGLDAPKGAREEGDDQEKVEVAPMDEDELIDEELERINAEKERRLRKERRRRNEERQKRVLKMQLQMTTPMDIGMDIQDEALQGEEFFNLRYGGANRRVADGEEAEEGSEDEDAATRAGAQQDDDSDDYDGSDAEEERRLDRLENEVEGMYEEYQQRLSERDAKHRAREARKANEHKDEWYGFKDGADDEGGNDAGSDAGSSDGGFEALERRKHQEETYDTDDEEDDADDREMRAAMEEEKARRQPKRKRDEGVNGFADDDVSNDSADEEKLLQTLESKDARKQQQSREAAIWFDNPLFKGINGLDGAEGDDDDDEDEDEDEDDGEEDESEDGGKDDDDDESEVSSLLDGNASDDDAESAAASDVSKEGAQQWRFEDEDEGAAKQKRIEDKGLTTAEAITLASQLVNREKTHTDLLDDGFNKHNFVDKTDLPKWFLDDEHKYYKSNVPVTKEAMEALKARERALDARPIKKVAEAKARKKMRALRRLETARKKADGISENVDISEREKAANIEKVLRRAGKTQQRKPLQVVVARGTNKGSGRPKGVKGRYRMVDRRGKKELRAQKRRDKKAGKKVSNPNAKPRVPNGYSKRI